MRLICRILDLFMRSASPAASPVLVAPISTDTETETVPLDDRLTHVAKVPLFRFVSAPYPQVVRRHLADRVRGGKTFVAVFHGDAETESDIKSVSSPWMIIEDEWFIPIGSDISFATDNVAVFQNPCFRFAADPWSEEGDTHDALYVAIRTSTPTFCGLVAADRHDMREQVAVLVGSWPRVIKADELALFEFHHDGEDISEWFRAYYVLMHSDTLAEG